MTTTPEAWDDVGSLRLQVQCISQQVGLNDDELRKLKKAIVLLDQQGQEPRRLMRLLSVIFAALLCVIALQTFSIYVGSASRVTDGQSNHASKMHVGDLKDSGATTLPSATKTNENKQTNTRNSQQLLPGKEDSAKQQPGKELLASGQGQGEASGHDTVSSMTSDSVDTAKPQVDKEKQQNMVEEQTLSNDISTAKRVLSTRLRKVVNTRKLLAEARKAEHKQTNSSGEEWNEAASGQKHRGDAVYQSLEDSQSTTDPEEDAPTGAGIKITIQVGKTKKWSDPDEEQVHEEKMLETSAESGRAESSVATVNDRSPLTDNLLKQGGHAVFYVCFPPGSLAHKVKKYAPIFNEVARSHKRTVSFCYLDTRKNLNELYEEHFCDDVTKTTFVFEKSRNDVVSDNKPVPGPQSEVPKDLSFGNCEDLFPQFPEWFDIESPVWFRRMFGPTQVIQASMVEEFIDDVYSKKLREAVPFKRDL